MNGNIFPLPFSTHLIFVVVAFVFFLIQFVRVRKKYQIFMAAAVAMTMMIYVNDTKLWFYGVGIIEFGLILIALVTAVAEKNNKTAIVAEAEAVETEAEAEEAAEENE